MKTPLFILTTCAFLTACSGGSILDNLPNRAPDYRQSSVNRTIEVPPDLTSGATSNNMAVDNFTPASVTSYNDFQNAQVQRNNRGYIQVLPQLYGVSVIENSGHLPYISTQADATTAWQIVKKYWMDNGVRLAIDNPNIGIMETDWLQNKADTPKTGISGLLNSLLGFVNDNDQRDRYRMRFSRNAAGGTDIALIYSKSELTAQYDTPSGTKDPAGFKWQESDNKNPELQLEMTRRIALYLSEQLKQRTGTQQSNNTTNHQTASHSYAMVTTLSNGQPALVINGNYAQNWRTLGIALDRASFTIEAQDYNSGSYKVRYTPQSDNQSQSFFGKLWGSNDQPNTHRPQYLIRLADQGSQSIAVVQNLDGTNANAAQARALLETVYSAI